MPYEIWELPENELPENGKLVGQTRSPGAALSKIQSIMYDNNERKLDVHLHKEDNPVTVTIAGEKEDGTIVARTTIFKR